MTIPSATSGPIERRVFGEWQTAGLTAAHTLRAVEGGIGTGTIELFVDGTRALMMPGPTGLAPTAVSAPGFVDGREVILCAGSPDGGLTVSCDVFLDGRSLTSGEEMDPVLRARSVGLVRPPSAGSPGRGYFPAAVALVGFGMAVFLAFRPDAPLNLALLCIAVALTAFGVSSARGR
jgi:hypothetical protein